MHWMTARTRGCVGGEVGEGVWKMGAMGGVLEPVLWLRWLQGRGFMAPKPKMCGVLEKKGRFGNLGGIGKPIEFVMPWKMRMKARSFGTQEEIFDRSGLDCSLCLGGQGGKYLDCPR